MSEQTPFDQSQFDQLPPDQPVPHQQDRIRFQPDGPEWRVVRIELQPLFDRLGIQVCRDWLTVKRPYLRAGRPCKARWLLQDDRLWLTGLWGRLDSFAFPDSLPRTPWAGDLYDDATAADTFRAGGHTRLWQRIFPNHPPFEPVLADWCDQELIVMEGERMESRYGSSWDNFKRHRLITIRRGVVERTWVRRNTPISEQVPESDGDDRKTNPTDRTQTTEDR